MNDLSRPDEPAPRADRDVTLDGAWEVATTLFMVAVMGLAKGAVSLNA
jgi:hypothetical protein